MSVLLKKAGNLTQIASKTRSERLRKENIYTLQSNLFSSAVRFYFLGGEEEGGVGKSYFVDIFCSQENVFDDIKF